MNSDKVFQIALFLSLITHSAVFLNYPNLFFLPSYKKPKKIQIVYLKNPPQLSAAQRQLVTQKVDLDKLTSRIKRLEKVVYPDPLNKEGLFNKNKPLVLRDSKFIKPTLNKPDIIAVKKKITLPPVEINKMNNPSYVSYYQIVREKIRRAAYQNYTHTATGEIYLAFLIDSQGILKEVRLIEGKSTPNQYLREIALRSIKEASPFPPFPKSLDYPQLSFNVIISFEIE